MSKGTQLWPGDRMQAFFRAHIDRETSLDPASAEKLAAALTKAVNRMLVWDMPPAIESAPPPAAAPASKTKSKFPAPAKAPPAATAAPAPNASPLPAQAPAFNPYAFSAMVVLAKTGRDGLLKRLADIRSIEHLKALAEAQHLAVNANLKKADDLRRAIVTATEQRLADRKAAAS